MKLLLKSISALVSLWFMLGLVACGGGGGSSDSSEPMSNNPPLILFTGIYIDSAVEGLNYQTAT